MNSPNGNYNRRADKLKVSHLVGIGIGGIIGAGYFLGCGLGIHEAGPSIVLAYLSGGLIMMQVLGAMTSINVNILAHGSFRVYTEQFLGQYFGFLLGWVVFISGIFSYSGISAVVMASTEVENPKVSIHRATIYMSLGVILIYFLSMLVLVNILSWSQITTNQSPFVQAFQALNLQWASTAVNLVILIAAFSVMTATYYSCIHMLVSLAESKKAPKIFLNLNNKGLYRNSWILVGFLSISLVSISFLVSQKLFNYLVSASSYFTFLNWLLNLFTYLVWMKKRHSDEKYNSPLIFGKYGAYLIIIVILFMFIMSLGVKDFRTGFYAATIISILISYSYILVQKTEV